MTAFEVYFTAIYDGTIVACEKMKRVSELLLERAASPGEYHFDPETAAWHIDFIEKFCRQPTGKRMGEPISLELFQRARLEAVFGFVDDNGLRQYNEVLIIEGRKNGKTTETAAVECDLLCNDGEGSPQIYNVATMLDQAKLGFNAAHRMVLQSPLLRRHIRKRAADLYFPDNLGFIKALASNSNSLDGLDTSGAVIDELGAIKDRDLYDLIKQSMSARAQPLLFTISTNGFVRNNIFDSQYEYAEKILSGREEDLRFLPFIYELDDVSEWDREEMWLKANPGLGTIKSLTFLREMVAKARKDPAFKPTVLVKDFNLPQNSESGFLRWEELENTAPVPAYPFRYFIGGMDAADSVDLFAAKAIMKRPGDPRIYVRSMYWIPQSVITAQEESGDRRGRDAVPYQLWADQGYLRICPGSKVSKRVGLDWFAELRDEYDIYPFGIGYDPWHISDELEESFEQEFGKDVFIPVRQGVKTLSDPMKALREEFCQGNVVYDNNPIDKWCFYNTSRKTDVNGNIQPVKKSDRTQRIDGFAALLDAYVIYYNHQEEYETMI